MKKTKTYNISDSIFDINDLKKIGRFFDDEAKKSEQRFRISYSIDFYDNTTFESDNINILDDDSINLKRPVKVEFDFFSYTQDKLLYFSLDSSSSYGNKIKISSQEDEWLNDKFIKIKEIIESKKAHKPWFIKHFKLISFFIIFAIGTLVFNLFFYSAGVLYVSSVKNLTFLEAYNHSVSRINEKFGNFEWYLNSTMAKLSAGFFFYFPFKDWVFSAYPNIELDFGAENLKTAKIRRKNISWIINAIIIPMVLVFIYDIAKMFF